MRCSERPPGQALARGNLFAPYRVIDDLKVPDRVAFAAAVVQAIGNAHDGVETTVRERNDRTRAVHVRPFRGGALVVAFGLKNDAKIECCWAGEGCCGAHENGRIEHDERGHES